MQDLNDLYYFSQVVEQGGFSAAARALDIPKSRLSRRISHLEESLGVRLLQRTTRRPPDGGGERYLHYCKEMAARRAPPTTPCVSCNPSPPGRWS